MDTGAWQGGFDRLNLQVVAPTLESGEEAVGIGESFPFPQPEIGQADLMGVVVEDHAALVADAVLLAVHSETVQVLTAPAEGDLQDLMQTSDSDRVGDLHLTPDQRTDPGQHHPQPVDRSERLRHRRLDHRHPLLSSFVGGPLRYTSARALWAKYRTTAEATATIHQLRHVHTSELVNAVVSLKTIHPRLGHTNAQTVQRYAEQKDATADAEIRS
jgi:Phage integrase family